MIDAPIHPGLSPNPRRGLILPLVLMALAVSVILGMCFLTSASTATQLSAAVDHRLRARMIAEAGLAITLTYIETDHNWRTERENGPWLAAHELDGGTFTVAGEDGDQVDANGAVIGDGNLADDATDPITVTCIGTYRGARHLVRAMRYPPRAAGISVNERVEVKKTGLIDSYNPEAGPYDAATATAKAISKSNGIARKPYIKLRNSAKVNGNVYYGPGGTYAKAVQKDSTAFSGPIGALPMAIASAAIDEPIWPEGGTGVTRSYSSGITTLSSDLWCDKYELKSTATLQVVGNVNLYVDGDFTVTDDARIRLGLPITYGAATSGKIELLDSARVDSYDSSLGPYGGTNIGSGPLLATNATAAGSITVNGGGTVVGGVYSGVGSKSNAISVTTGGTITGEKKALSKPFTIAPPPTPPVLTALGDYERSTGIDVILLDMKVGKFTLTGGATVQVSGHRKVHATDVVKIDGAALEILPDSSLTLYAGNQIYFTGNGARVNANTKDPSKVVIYSTGSGFTHTITNYAEVYAIIDAPNASLRLDDQVHLYGAFMGQSLVVKGQSQFHLDRNPAIFTVDGRLPVTYTTGNKLTVHVHNSTKIQKKARVNANTADPLNVMFHHWGPVPMEVKEDAVVYAEAIVPEAICDISGTTSQWTGRIRARDLIIGGKATVTADDTGGTSNPGLIVEETVEVKDSAIVNGTGGTALIASHGATDTTLWIKDSGVYKGDGYTTPGGNPTDEIRVAMTATYTGTKNALILPVPIAALTAPPVVGTPVDRVISGTNVAVISGNVYYKKLEVKDDAVLEVDGNTQVVLTGELKFSKNARLVLRPGARLTIHCPKEVKIEESPQLNVGGHPGRFTLSCTVAPKIELKKTAKLCATILGPLTELKIEEKAEFFGAFSGRRVQIDDEGKFHCAHNQAGPISWVEQQ